jgi:hypothetical protein
MSDEPRPGSRIPVITIDREGRLVRYQELTEEEIAALRARHVRGDTPASVHPAAPPVTVTQYPVGLTTTHTYSYDDTGAPPPVRFEHDPAARVYRLTAPDGTVETFRDGPTKYLRLEPDPETGAMRPVTKRGRPVYLYLAREDREAR